MVRSGLVVAAAVTLALVASLVASAATATGAAADAGPASGGGSAGAVTCGYSFVAWDGGFVADLRIVNDGPTIDGWTVAMAFDTPTTLQAAWLARMSQPDVFTMVAESLHFNRVIPTGGAVTFGWTATTAAHEVPTLSVNGVPC
jgi:hypothetical protein